VTHKVREEDSKPEKFLHRSTSRLRERLMLCVLAHAYLDAIDESLPLTVRDSEVLIQPLVVSAPF
jgi:hypothetical protein